MQHQPLKINTCFIQAAAFIGLLSIILGAFGAHGIKGRVTTEAFEIFETGVRYQMYHVFALLAVGILWAFSPRPNCLKWAGCLFIAGILLFSGSLYLLTYAMGTANPDLFKYGVITPIGGFCFIAAWILLIVSFIRKKA
ncbi:Uncharacterized membrane protein YgdD, TMEM256/DUF423 family [Arachidicoccus rhizosphaerae]|uniref:Uncharacterized membrane protein YgdD, TMEM256/DUF423 family n=1 Tax=Arachidicoccus rhizosphaerae TaxID=551991 RepID=A0A1H4AF84_9BACT|nr:DUF423 domain-containing protein [Arachidicoccus rhizosphaerae]SEA34378.1 Uncharacterized membrane protein YgdD, TMEM256/DUF423 family [Arachidicoccus rhizosphaerae]